MNVVNYSFFKTKLWLGNERYLYLRLFFRGRANINVRRTKND